MAKEPAQNGTATQDPVNQLDAIKNIIFGQEMQQMDSRIQDLNGAQKDLGASVEQKMSEMESSLVAEMKDMKEALLSEFSTRMDSLQADLDQMNENKADRKQLGELLVKLGEQLLKD